ncbi:alpha/beta fold hydrolase [Luteimonas sp. Y-2-2-4F]|nr:alpha/beta fold hydrolase [Luteimonas sp. Y-2-2-4F]MCD9033531.1 alpha/beta fold hydrolase [Luteimonas sp. Y-2-2-4F]
MTDIVLVHGAWHGGWCWDRVAALLRGDGHRVSAPTLAGLDGGRAEPAHAIGLGTHVDDIVAHVQDAGLRAVTLVAHSYGGFPATVAAHRLGTRVADLVLLDAFLPADGEMLLDHAAAMIAPYAAAMAADPGWRIPPLPSSAFGVGPADQPWVDARLRPQPPGSYFERARLPSPLPTARKRYIRCTRAPGELLQRSLGRVRDAGDWRYLELDAPHDAMITHPHALAGLLADAT